MDVESALLCIIGIMYCVLLNRLAYVQARSMGGYFPRLTTSIKRIEVLAVSDVTSKSERTAGQN